MRKKGIAFKLFVITALFFLVLLSVILFGQSIFFETFYINQKIDRLERGLNQFALKYQEGAWDQDTITKKINQFMNQSSAQVAILNEMGAVKHRPSFHLVIETEDRQSVMVPVNHLNLAEMLEEFPLQVGASITVTGVREQEAGILYPYRIESQGNQWEALASGRFIVSPGLRQLTIAAQELELEEDVTKELTVTLSEAPLEPIVVELEAEKSATVSIVSAERLRTQAIMPIQVEEVKGIVKELNYPAQKELVMQYQEEILWTAINNWFWLLQGSKMVPEENELISYRYVNEINGMENVVMIKPLFQGGQLQEMVFSMISLQPVGEAIEVMKSYYIYVLLGAVLLTLLLTYIYSRLIATPLLKINRVAKSMAELDFSASCDIATEDEIGTLAASLNRLSANLKENMSQLQNTNERLRVEIEKERSLEKMRKEFVSSVSHELKTPLGIMKGFTEGLKDGVALDKKEYYLDVILDEIGKMDCLVLDMLELSKLETNGYCLMREPFDLEELLKEVTDRFLPQLEEKEIQVLGEGKSLGAAVLADRRKIEQVITNMMTNAIRHTDKGGTIRLGIQQAGEQVIVDIENSGSTIPESQLDRIWDRFYRVEESRNRQSGGTGLGLSIVRNILELHQSRYGVENTSLGVRFFFALESAPL